MTFLHLYLKTAIYLSLLLTLNCCTPKKITQPLATQAPPLWIVQDSDSSLYLYGTVHLLPDKLIWQTADMHEAFDQAGSVFFEVSSTETARLRTASLLAESGYLDSGQFLTEHLDDYHHKLLEAATHNSGIPKMLLERMKPWLASEFLTLIAAQQAGLSSQLAADEALKSRARLQQKNILYLETIDSQINIGAGLPQVLQMALLHDVLINFNRIGTDMRQTAQAWANGQTDTLNRTLITSMAEKHPVFYERLFVARNKAWADQLADYLEQSGTGFVAIGIGHLLGTDSLQMQLRAKGYKVHRYFAHDRSVIDPSFTIDDY